MLFNSRWSKCHFRTAVVEPPPPPPDPIPDPTVFTSNFDIDENPLSESGAWGRNQSNAWTNVRKVGGVAVGTQARDTFDDSYAIKTGDWGANYEIEATIFRHPNLTQTTSAEVELNFRAVDGPTSCRMYEVLLNRQGQLECFRWGGPFDSFTRIVHSGAGEIGRATQTGDKYRGRIVGDLITIWVNDIQIATFNIASIPGIKFVDGNPAIAFFGRPLAGYNPDHYGYTDVKVTKL